MIDLFHSLATIKTSQYIYDGYSNHIVYWNYAERQCDRRARKNVGVLDVNQIDEVLLQG